MLENRTITLITIVDKHFESFVYLGSLTESFIPFSYPLNFEQPISWRNYFKRAHKSSVLIKQNVCVCFFFLLFVLLLLFRSHCAPQFILHPLKIHYIIYLSLKNVFFFGSSSNIYNWNKNQWLWRMLMTVQSQFKQLMVVWRLFETVLSALIPEYW